MEWCKIKRFIWITLILLFRIFNFSPVMAQQRLMSCNIRSDILQEQFIGELIKSPNIEMLYINKEVDKLSAFSAKYNGDTLYYFEWHKNKSNYKISVLRKDDMQKLKRLLNFAVASLSISNTSNERDSTFHYLGYDGKLIYCGEEKRYPCKDLISINNTILSKAKKQYIQISPMLIDSIENLSEYFYTNLPDNEKKQTLNSYLVNHYHDEYRHIDPRRQLKTFLYVGLGIILVIVIVLVCRKIQP